MVTEEKADSVVRYAGKTVTVSGEKWHQDF
jgi:hypothetical protein